MYEIDGCCCDGCLHVARSHDLGLIVGGACDPHVGKRANPLLFPPIIPLVKMGFQASKRGIVGGMVRIVYTCIYVFIVHTFHTFGHRHTYIEVYTYEHISMPILRHVRFAHICTCVHTDFCTCMCTYICVYKCVCMHVYMNTFIFGLAYSSLTCIFTHN